MVVIDNSNDDNGNPSTDAGDGDSMDADGEGWKLGWEFQFSVPISGTPIRSGIPILFLIPKIPVDFFFEIPMSGKQENWNSDLQNLELR